MCSTDDAAAYRLLGLIPLEKVLATEPTTLGLAMDEPLQARLWHRLPWLTLGLVGSAGAAVLVEGFEADLMSDVRLAFFIPGIVDMADAVGTQTETLVIRGLLVGGVPIRRVFRMETLTACSSGWSWQRSP